MTIKKLQQQLNAFHKELEKAYNILDHLADAERDTRPQQRRIQAIERKIKSIEREIGSKRNNRGKILATAVNAFSSLATIRAKKDSEGNLSGFNVELHDEGDFDEQMVRHPVLRGLMGL